MLPLKVQYMSDLHLEFKDNREYFKYNPISPSGDILILAGDINYLSEYNSDYMQKWFRQLSDMFLEIFIIPGNHEFYLSEDDKVAVERYLEMTNSFDGLKDLKFSNVAATLGPINSSRVTKYFFSDNGISNIHFLNNASFTLDGSYFTSDKAKESGYDSVKIIGTTLWSNINEVYPVPKNVGMSDWYYYYDANLRLYPDIIKKVYDKSVTYIQNELRKSEEKQCNIVVTHHCPSVHPFWESSEDWNRIKEEYQNGLISCYVTDVGNRRFFIEDGYNPDYWIYGHNHYEEYPMNECEVFKTKLLKNTFGYRFEGHPKICKFNGEKLC